MLPEARLKRTESVFERTWSDDFSGYNKLAEVTRCGCRGHLRRKFAEAIPKGKASGINGSQALIGIGYCDRLFEIEDELKAMSPEDRYIKRLEPALCRQP